jgi:hypothetical protein
MIEMMGHPESEELVRLDGAPLEHGLPRQLVATTYGRIGWMKMKKISVLLNQERYLFMGTSPQGLLSRTNLRHRKPFSLTVATIALIYGVLDL